MRIKLSFKFFLAFLATSMTIIVVMVMAMQFFARKNFEDYIHQVEATRLSELSSMLGREYQNNTGWKGLRNDPRRWRRILRPRDSAAYKENPPALPPGFESPLKPPPPPRRRRGDERRGPERKAFPNYSPPDRQPPPGIEHRLALFDEHKQPVAGRAESAEGHTLQAIVVDGNTVGWLALRNEERPTDPLGIAFLAQQTQAFYTVGAVMLALAALVAFLLARHLLAPVRELITGTRSLTSRKFDTRINITTTDELGELARDFNQMAKTLELYEQLRQQWISDIAHELRTPLSILRGEIEALQDGLRQATPERLASLHTEVVHMSKIVQNLHDLSLAESAAIHFKKEPVNLVAAVRASLQKFKGRFAEQGIALVDELGSAETTAIWGDRDRLLQVFSNLMENSLRYTDSPGSLTVRQLCTASEVLLQFSDTVPGVPKESLPRLFDRLYRVDKSRSRAHGGSGLGLSICKTIIEAHGGTIKAQQARDGGLLVEISLPLQKKQARKAAGDNDA